MRITHSLTSQQGTLLYGLNHAQAPVEERPRKGRVVQAADLVAEAQHQTTRVGAGGVQEAELAVAQRVLKALALVPAAAAGGRAGVAQVQLAVRQRAPPVALC